MHKISKSLISVAIDKYILCTVQKKGVQQFYAQNQQVIIVTKLAIPRVHNAIDVP